MRTSALLAAVLLASSTAAATAGPPKVAAFDFELYDTSTEGDLNGPRADEAQRIAEVTDQIRAFLKAQKLEVVDTAPAKAQVEAQVLRTCGDCPAEIAKSLGADYALMGYVQKVSNLILNINVEIRDVKTGAVVRKGSVDIRGNNHESWRHGASYLMRNQIFKTPLAPAAS